MGDVHLYFVDWLQRALDESGISPSSSNAWHDRHIVCLNNTCRPLNIERNCFRVRKTTSNWRSFMWCVTDHTFLLQTGLHSDPWLYGLKLCRLEQWPSSQHHRLEVETSGLWPFLEKPYFTIELGIFLLSPALGQIHHRLINILNKMSPYLFFQSCSSPASWSRRRQFLPLITEACATWDKGFLLTVNQAHTQQITPAVSRFKQ